MQWYSLDSEFNLNEIYDLAVCDCCWCMFVAAVAKCGSMKKCIQNTPLCGCVCIFNFEGDPQEVGLIGPVSLEIRMMLVVVSFFLEGKEGKV